MVFFRAKRVFGHDPNYDQRWSKQLNCKEKIVSPISNSHTLRKMADIQYVGHKILETTWFPPDSVPKSFWGRWLWIWHRIFVIQNGGPNMADIISWKPNDFRETLYSRVFGVADYEFDIQFPFFEMVDPIWRTWNFGNYDVRTTLYSGVFGVANYEFQIGFSDFHIADPIWQT